MTKFGSTLALPGQLTVSGPIYQFRSAGTLVPIAVTFMNLRDIAWQTVENRQPPITMLGTYLNGDECERYHREYAGQTIGAFVTLGPLAQQRFFSVLLDYLEHTQDATGLEGLLMTAIQSTWSFLDPTLALRSVKAWTKYGQRTSFAAEKRTFAFDEPSKTLRVFKPGAMTRATIHDALVDILERRFRTIPDDGLRDGNRGPGFGGPSGWSGGPAGPGNPGGFDGPGFNGNWRSNPAGGGFGFNGGGPLGDDWSGNPAGPGLGGFFGDGRPNGPDWQSDPVSGTPEAGLGGGRQSGRPGAGPRTRRPDFRDPQGWDGSPLSGGPSGGPSGPKVGRAGSEFNRSIGDFFGGGPHIGNPMNASGPFSELFRGNPQADHRELMGDTDHYMKGAGAALVVGGAAAVGVAGGVASAAIAVAAPTGGVGAAALIPAGGLALFGLAMAALGTAVTSKADENIAKEKEMRDDALAREREKDKEARDKAERDKEKADLEKKEQEKKDREKKEQDEKDNGKGKGKPSSGGGGKNGLYPDPWSDGGGNPAASDLMLIPVGEGDGGGIGPKWIGALPVDDSGGGGPKWLGALPAEDGGGGGNPNTVYDVTTTGLGGPGLSSLTIVKSKRTATVLGLAKLDDYGSIVDRGIVSL